MTTNTTTSNKFYVYGHYRADTGELFYIGKGHGKRAWAKSGRNPDWKSVVAKQEYQVKILYNNLSEEDAYAKERELISEVGRDNLTNITDGGHGGIPSPEWRARMQTVYDDPTWRKKNKEFLQQLWQDPEYRKKMKEVAQRTAQDPEWRRKHKEIRQQLAQDPEHRKKIKEGCKARSQNLEWQKNVAEANKKLSQDPEWRRKIKETKQTPESRIKQKEAYRIRSQDPEWRRKNKEILIRSSNKQKKKAILISPTGEMFHMHGVAEFARTHDLSSTCVSSLINKKYKSCHGWRLHIPPDNNHLINQFTL